MDINKIKDIVYSYLPLEIFNSYPVAVRGNDGNIIIVWFNFGIPEEGNEESADVRITANTAYCMDREYNVESREFPVDEIIQYEVTEEPELDYNKYMDRLGELIDNYDEAAMRSLLAASEQFYIADIAFRAAELFI